jgi:3-hydroxyacyl-[acyl-carrier-protein] dehydratase
VSQSRTTWDIEWIREILPHRYPLLLVDRVLELEPRKRIVALKNFTANEEFFLGHFPGHPVVPGVLLLEALAQAGGILLVHDLEDRGHTLLYFAGADKVRFRRPVVPGDQARLEVDLLRMRSRAARLRGVIRVDGEVAVEGILSCVTVNR